MVTDQAAFSRASAQCGTVTLIQRFGGAPNLNIHFHNVWQDGVYQEDVEQGRASRDCTVPERRAPRS